jgi:hypothetical protein
MVQAQKLSSLQLELLKTYSFQPNEEDLLAIRAFLANYFSKKFIQKIEKSVVEKGITEQDLDNWLNE